MRAISAPRPARSTNDAEHLLELYWERAYRFAAMITRNQHESADIAQEALLKVLRQLDRFDPTVAVLTPGCGASSSTSQGTRAERLVVSRRCWNGYRA
jgi:hypothetical protein